MRSTKMHICLRFEGYIMAGRRCMDVEFVYEKEMNQLLMQFGLRSPKHHPYTLASASESNMHDDVCVDSILIRSAY